uniref:Uncharacterized protein n=1 Tax=Anguilla anguilla TaxID=7936 RepID=A0A0E9TTC7_ANGAN
MLCWINLKFHFSLLHLYFLGFRN